MLKLNCSACAHYAHNAHSILQLLAEACNSICENLLDFMTNRYATHVARRLLCIIAGRNVLPLAAKSQNKVNNCKQYSCIPGRCRSGGLLMPSVSIAKCLTTYVPCGYQLHCIAATTLHVHGCQTHQQSRLLVLPLMHRCLSLCSSSCYTQYELCILR